MEDFELLVCRIRQGDKQAFKQLFKAYYARLCFFALKYMPDEQSSEDIVQEVLSDLWTKRKTIQINTSLKSFLYACVRNKCLTQINKKTLPKESLLDIPTDYEISEDYNYIKEEIYANLHKAIESLSDKAKQVVVLSMKGLSNEEIADKMDISINTVKSNKKRAYFNIRKMLEDYI
ncbi:MAG: RNA polymerase sigma factor [Bacteroidales bacterium]